MEVSTSIIMKSIFIRSGSSICLIRDRPKVHFLLCSMAMPSEQSYVLDFTMFLSMKQP